MPNTDMTGLAWPALIARWEPESEERDGRTIHRLDEPTLEIIMHDLEAKRWEAVGDYLGLAIEEMLEREEILAELTALARAEELPRLRKTLITPTVFDKEDTIKAHEAHGARFEPSPDGRYSVATCLKCKHRAAGPVDLVNDAMEEHADTHATKTKRRCATHGVWAREDDGRCKRCDERKASAPTDTDKVMAALREAIENARKANPERIAQVKQQVEEGAPAKLVLGVRGNGLLARRSAHVLAKVTGMPQHELAKLTADEARALTQERGIEADWVAASAL